MFIFSFNDESKISPILLDRLIIIKTDGFKDTDKLEIANKFLLPKILSKIKIDEKDISIDNAVIKYIIEKYTDEKGVRKLNQCLNAIISKINILLLTEDLTIIDNLFDEFKEPFIINKLLTDKILKKCSPI